jgi:hypothetical protein
MASGSRKPKKFGWLLTAEAVWKHLFEYVGKLRCQPASGFSRIASVNAA